MTNPISTELRGKDVPLMQSGAFKDTRAVIRKAADHIDAQDAKIKALVDAAEPYISPVRTADYGAQMKQHQALVSAIAAAKEPT